VPATVRAISQSTAAGVIARGRRGGECIPVISVVAAAKVRRIGRPPSWLRVRSRAREESKGKGPMWLLFPAAGFQNDGLRLRKEVAIADEQTSVFEDADMHGSGLQADAAVESMRLGGA